MKLSRKLAVASGALLVAAATVFSAGAANAAFTSPTEVSYTQIRSSGYVAVVDGFGANEPVTVAVDGVTSPIPTAADANGVVTLAPYSDPTAVVGDDFVFAVTGTTATQSLTVFVIWDAVDPALGSAPASITVSAFGTTGYIATSGGFAPGEVVDVGTGRSGSLGSATADGTGTVTFTYVDATGVVGERIDFAFVGATSRAVFAFDVVADPAVAAAAAPAPRLAETGADLTGGFIAAGALLLVGAGFAFVATRRRTARA